MKWIRCDNKFTDYQLITEDEEALEMLSCEIFWLLSILYSSSVIFNNKLYFSFSSLILN